MPFRLAKFIVLIYKRCPVINLTPNSQPSVVEKGLMCAVNDGDLVCGLNLAEKISIHPLPTRGLARQQNAPVSGSLSSHRRRF